MTTFSFRPALVATLFFWSIIVVFAQYEPVFLPVVPMQERAGRWAITDTAGQLLTPFQFQEVSGDWPDRVVASTGGAYFGAWDATGRLLIPEQYDRLEALPGGFWNAWRYGQCALLGPDGQPRTDFAFDQVLALPDGRTLVSRQWNGWMQLYDPVKKRLGEQRFETQRAASFWLVRAEKASAWTVLTWAGPSFDIPCGGMPAEPQAGDPPGWLRLMEYIDEGTEGFGWYDRPSGFCLAPRFADVRWLGGHILAHDYQNIFDYTRDGRLLATRLYEEAFQTETQGYSPFFLGNGRWGIRDKTGHTLAPPVYEWFYEVALGNIIARKDGHYGLLNAKGEVLLPFEYDNMNGGFNQQILVLRRGQKHGLADAKGHLLLPLDCDTLAFCPPGALWIRRGDKTETYRIEGSTITLLPYDQIGWQNGMYFVSRAGLWGMLDGGFAEIVPLEYTSIRFSRLLFEGQKKAGTTRWYRLGSRLVETPLEALQAYWTTGVLAGRRAGYWGLYGRDLHEIVPPVYDQMLPVGQPGIIAVARRGNTAWAIGTGGTAVDSFACDTVLRHHGPFLQGYREGRYFLRNLLNGKELAGSENELQWWPDLDFLLVQTADGVHCYDASLSPVRPFVLDKFPVSIENETLFIGQKAGKDGLFVPGGKQILPFEYDRIWRPESGYYLPFLSLEKHGKQGRYDLLTGRIFPAEFDQLYFLEGTYLLAGAEGALALFSPNYKRLTGFDLERAEPFGQGLFIGQKAGRFGLLDTLGREVLPFEFESIYPADGQPVLLVQQGDKTGLAGSNGRMLVQPFFVGYESAGSLAIKVYTADGAMSLYGWDGREILAPAPEQTVHPVSDSFFLVRRAEKYALLALDGHWVRDEWFDEMTCESNACAAKSGDRWGLMATDGRELLPFDYDLMANSDEPTGIFMAGKAGRFGFIDQNGRWLTPLQFDYADPFSRGRAAVQRDGKWGYLDAAGRWAIPPRFDYADSFSWPRNEALIIEAGRYAVIDTAGRVLRPFSWTNPEDAGLLQRHLQNRRNGDQLDSALIDWQDRVVVVAPGARISWVKYGLIQFSFHFDTRCIYPPYGLMNLAGKVVAALLYENFWFDFLPATGLLPAKKNGKMGFIDPYGQVVVPFEYDEIRLDHLGSRELMAAKKGAKWGFIDLAGRVVIPFEYDNVWNLETLDQPGVWIGGVHKAGQSWIIDRQGRKIRD